MDRPSPSAGAFGLSGGPPEAPRFQRQPPAGTEPDVAHEPEQQRAVVAGPAGPEEPAPPPPTSRASGDEEASGGGLAAVLRRLRGS